MNEVLNTKAAAELKELLNKELDLIANSGKNSAKNSKNLKPIQKMWDDFTYKVLLEVPPIKKPCFLAGTLVKTTTGKVAIEDVVPGQQVYAYNFALDKLEVRSVTETYRNRTEVYICIQTQNGKIEATGKHQFWNPLEKKWIMANSLEVGMNLLDSKGQYIVIQSLEIKASIVPTYDLEIEELHNYYVGEDEVLTHNKNRTSTFASTELINVEFYEILGEKKEGIYVGQTIQELGARFEQHRSNPKKAFWRKKMKGVFELSIHDERGPFKMTPYETAVVAMYEINTRGGIRKNNQGLYNKQRPIGKKKFELFKKLGTFNPCKFYV
ncbi:polymorphic toxin-type HINT domain-containing protein [Flavobacterium sp. JP2137]|uniref:polymorphic toxin-type HINT domain-containing protein n=1 Tax=Flavobacterium sp. JP2137 TaxID=3414510 RepID=UPI003D2FA5ED